MNIKVRLVKSLIFHCNCSHPKKNPLSDIFDASLAAHTMIPRGIESMLSWTFLIQTETLAAPLRMLSK